MQTLDRLKKELSNQQYFTDEQYIQFLAENTYTKEEMQKQLLLTVLDVHGSSYQWYRPDDFHIYGVQHLQHKPKQLITQQNPDPCRVPDASGIEPGSGKEPDNDGV